MERELDVSEPIIRGPWGILREPDRIALEDPTLTDPTNRLYDTTRVTDRCTDLASCPLKMLIDQNRARSAS